MDARIGDSQRHKRKVRSDEDDKWECSVCTYINPSESYKCEMCGMRKGTSTRKPRLNPQVVEQQQLIAQAILKDKDDDHRKRKDTKTSSAKLGIGNLRLNSVDRSSPLLFKVFANGYSVVITEFQLKPKVKSLNSLDSPATSNCSSLQSFTGVCGPHSEQLSPTDSIHASSDRNGNLEHFAECDLTDSVELKAPRNSSFKPIVNLTTAGADTVPHSCSWTSSSAAYNNLANTSNSTPNSRLPSPSHLKSESQRETIESGLAIDRSSVKTVDDKHGRARSMGRQRGRKKTTSSASRCSQPASAASDSATASSVDEDDGDIRSAQGDHSKQAVVPELPTIREHKGLKRRHHQNNVQTPEEVSVKRKRNKGYHRNKAFVHSDSNCQHSSTESMSPSSVTPSPSWSANEEYRDSKALSLRISVSSRGGTQSPDATPNRERSPISKKRRQTGGSQRTGLKCKIRVLHTSSPEEPDTRVMTFSTSPTASMADQNDFDKTAELCSTSTRFAALDTSCTTAEPSTLTVQPRLSTESKNTSAMTDSSGANALEISH